MGFCEGINARGNSSVAASSCLAVDDDLRRKSEVRPGSVSYDVEPISDGAGGSLGPAASAVSGNMLVLVPRKVVDSFDVPPVERFRDVSLA